MADASEPTRVLLATDADWIFDEVDAALASDDTEVYRVRRGSDVLPAVIELDADLVILDLQIGSMGGMATCMEIRNEEGADRLPITAVMMLLDRGADVFLAKRADADGWVFKPLDAFRLRRAAATLIDGYSWYEGVDARTNLPTGLPAEFDTGEEHLAGADEDRADEAAAS
jgi:DNA-binding response OmpR family regulator